MNKWLTKHAEQLKKRSPLFPSTVSITGVSAYLGKYFNVNPILVRLGFIVSTFLLSPWIVVGYLGLAAVLPKISVSDQLLIEEKKEETPEVTSFELCEHCQTAVKSGSVYCHRCGTKL